ncbi:hypothetical protein JZ751_027485 [Albula glossodonta]|uniref:Uncharacterized protein n=1 Tax=Albula glossodonta TaxID=121402 RepID=A0A8T2NCW6_9TELE|nr:hypothetical protein JZ751_027485 [Albula glossodonta]
MRRGVLLLILGLSLLLFTDLVLVQAQCPLGYSGRRGKACRDVNECEDPAAVCGLNASCTNTNGSFYCQCNSGFRATSGTVNFTILTGSCEDINECVEDKEFCGLNAECQNTIGAHFCTCRTGFISSNGNEIFLAPEGVTCKDRNECEADPSICGSNAACFNTLGSYHCECDAGFSVESGERKFTEGSCKDEDECERDPPVCGRNGTCTNTLGAYTCTCPPGFSSLGSGHSPATCSDIDECLAHSSICGEGGVCNNTEGSYMCSCKPGFSNYGNSLGKCIELNCDHFSAMGSPDQMPAHLKEVLSLMKSSCSALSRQKGEQPHGEKLLKTLLSIMDKMLSGKPLKGNRQVSAMLNLVENALRLIGPLLSSPQTTTSSKYTEVEFLVERGQQPPQGQISLSSNHSHLDTHWETAAGNDTYPGFAAASLLTYKNLESSTNDFFPELRKDNKSIKFTMNSKVVTASVSNPDTGHLQKPVQFTFKHLQPTNETHCVYWDALNGDGAWSMKGCRVDQSNATHTVCSCTHLSSFAVLMALYEFQVRLSRGVHSTQLLLCAPHCSPPHQLKGNSKLKHCYTELKQCKCCNEQYSSDIDPFELQVITYVGLAVSQVCLLICIITFYCCRSIQGTRNTIHLHLCICLFIANLVFLAGISSTQNKGGCAFVAGVLHFCFLAAFCWMCLEGVQLYRMVVLVFNTTFRPLYMMAAGYGVPTVIVTISALVYAKGYGTDRHCWLTLERGFIWSFFGPVCVIIMVSPTPLCPQSPSLCSPTHLLPDLLVNAFFFMITVWKLAEKFASLNPDLTSLRKIKAFTVTAVAQLCVLGTMWIFGCFLFEESTLPLAYIFTFLNSLQGALLFIMHCLMSKPVREEYSRLWSRLHTPQKKYSEFSTNQSSNSQASKSVQNTGESRI